ncbi:MAG: cation:proton antiporter [Solirubrobacterales bacterium]
MSTNDILTGLGLVIVLAIASRLVAERFRIPAIVLLLPVGFVAGAITDDVHPDALFGSTFQPLVSLGVGLILFEAGLRLRIADLGAGVRTVVLRLISVGTLLTLAGVTVAVELIFGLDWGVSLVLGAILVVSGPTVVLPLLAFVRPSDRIRSVLKWEGTLIDPIGALLGVIAFQAAQQGAVGGRPFHPGEMALALGVGLAVGLAGAAILRALLAGLQRTSPGQAVAAALMMVAGAVVAADLIREDSGFVAAVVMGMALANQRELDVSRILEFHGTVVGLLIGMLFVLISASVTPSEVSAVLPEGLLLIAVMVLLIRPVVVALGTWRSELTIRERAFAAWMAPRGIVAASTASAFGLELTQSGVSGAEKILPIAFVAIFGTVVLYGLTAEPVSRLLGVAGAGAPVVLVVGGHAWAREIAAALAAAGLEVRMWTSRPDEQAAAKAIGIESRRAPLAIDVEDREAELEGVSHALLMTESDDFNELAAFELRQELGIDRVYRLPARHAAGGDESGNAEAGVMFTAELTFPELTRRFEAGARLIETPPAPGSEDALVGEGVTPLFTIDHGGGLGVASADAGSLTRSGRAICLAEGGPRTSARPDSP